MTGTLSPSLVTLPFWYNSLDERHATDRTCPILGEECSIISFPLCLALWRSPPVVYAVESSSAGSCGSRRVALRARKQRPHRRREPDSFFLRPRTTHRKQALRHLWLAPRRALRTILSILRPTTLPVRARLPTAYLLSSRQGERGRGETTSACCAESAKTTQY